MNRILFVFFQNSVFTSFQPIDVNIEIWMVLGSLLEIKNNANAFNNWTVDLLKVVKAKLTELLDEVKSMPLNAIDSWNNEFKLMQCVDENKFEFQRFLFCRICGVSCLTHS